MNKYKSVITLLIIIHLLCVSNSFAQNNLIKDLKSFNEKANFEKSKKVISKYKEKFDTLNFNYQIGLSDYYLIKNNPEYDIRKSLKMLNSINCLNFTDKDKGVYFKKDEECDSYLDLKKSEFIKSYFSIVEKSDDLDSLRYFISDSKDFPQFRTQIIERLARFVFDYYLSEYNQGKNPKSELIQFVKDFPNTSYVAKAQKLIEEIDYRNAENLNTKASYNYFLNAYPNSSIKEKVLTKIEDLGWKECITLNTKNSFQTFINDFPNSAKLQEAKMMLGKFVDVYNLKTINSFSTLSNEKQMFEPFKISNGKIEHPRLTLLKICHNGKTALAITSFANGLNSIKSDNIARLIDLTDGAIIFEFPYVGFSNYFFNSDDSKLFYYDNKFIKQLDLNSYELTNLFEVESNAYNFQYMFLEYNTIHFCQDQYESPSRKFLHYTYDLATVQKDLEVFYEFEYPVRGDIQKEFSSFTGTTEEKLLKLKLIYGDEIIIKPLTKNSTNEFLILKFPELTVIKNGVIKYNNNITIKKTDKVTNEVKNESFELARSGWYNKEIQLTDNNRIIFTSRKSLFILQLGSEDGFFPNDEIKATQVDPFNINISSRDGFMFAQLDEKTNRLYYQIDIGSGCDYDDDNEIYVYNYSNKFSSSKKGIQTIIKNKLYEIDKSLSSFYNAHINSEAIKNQPLESDNEKYLRVRDIYLKMKPTFNKIQDSLFYSLNEIVKDSIKMVKYDPVKVFITSNYNVDNEYWRLAIKNPFNGKNFSLIYNESKADAKLNLSNNFSNILLEVKYYFNLISLSYEPILVSITNKQSKICDKFIIPYKDGSLIKNLYLTDNSFIENYYLDCRLERGDIYYDENILRYFVNNGKPKYYFNYGFVDPAQSNKPGVSIRNLDDVNINFTFQNKFENCCPPSSEAYRSYRDGVSSEYLRFDDIPYYINKSVASTDKDATSIYELNKTAPLGIMDGVLYPNGESPNGKYSVDTSGVYEKASGICLLKFQNATGKVYWDCNSYYFGIGYDVFPVLMLETVLK